MTIDDIADKIIESKNNDIAKAFTMHIGSLLINNGIVPIMTEYTGNDVKNITDTNEYKLVMEYGIAFNELDCSKHDMEIYNKAIDDFADYLRMSYDKGMRLSVAMCKNEVEKFKLKALYSRFINAIDDCVKAFKEIEQLKAGGPE